MNWFYLSLIAPILWTVVNHVDKYMLSKVFRTNVIGSIFLFSGFFSLLVSVCVLFYPGAEIMSVPFKDRVILLLVGAFNALAFYLYLYALKDEETSIVVPFLQLIPVFTYLLGYIFLNEVLNSHQLIASIIILSGIFLISIDFDIDNNVKLKYRIILIMSVSSVFFALHDVAFKFVAVKDSFANATFWQYLGVFLVSVFTFIFVPIHRREFLEVFKLGRFKIFYLSAFSETLYIAGNLVSNFATLLVPVVLVSVVSSYQPLFVFISGVLLALFLPNVSKERISLKHLIQKSVSIIIIIIGSYLLYTTN